MIIYLARNRINGKVYVGQTVVSLAERMGDHRRKALVHRSRSHFHSAIRKYGFDAFEWTILERSLMREALNSSERAWIKKYHSTDPRRGYNNTTGGDACEFTEEAKKRIGDAGKGRKLRPEHIEALRRRFSGEGNPFYGKHHSDDARAKNRAAHVGKKLRPEHIAKCIHRGEDNGLATITEETARAIKRMIAAGVRQGEIVRSLGVTINHVKNIRRGSCWRHVQI